MVYLRQSTASQEITLGTFVDDTDGKTAEMGLTIVNTDIKIFKAGASAEVAKNSGGATHDAGGRYIATLDATDTNTIGSGQINVHVSGALPVKLQFTVLHANVYDALFGSAALSTHTAADVWGVGTRVLTAGTNIVLAKGTGVTGFNDLSAAQVNAEADTALADVGVTTTITGRIDAAISTRLASAGYTAPLDAAGVRTAVGLATANLDNQLAAIPTAAEIDTQLSGSHGSGSWTGGGGGGGSQLLVTNGEYVLTSSSINLATDGPGGGPFVFYMFDASTGAALTYNDLELTLYGGTGTPTWTERETGVGELAGVISGLSSGDRVRIEAYSPGNDLRGDVWLGFLAPNTTTGTGARTVTITVNDGTSPLEAARVRVTQGTESYSKPTDVSGVVTFNLDDATWTVAISKAGYSFAGASLVVNGDETQTYSMTSVVITPGDPDTTTAYVTIRDVEGVAVSGATVQLQVLKFETGTTGSGIDNPLATGTTNGSGYVEFPGLPRLARYQARVGTDGSWSKGTTLDADTTPLSAVLGVAE